MDKEQSIIIIAESLQKDVSKAKVTEIENEYSFGYLFEVDNYSVEIRTYKESKTTELIYRANKLKH